MSTTQICTRISSCLLLLYLSMILGANFSPGSRPEIPLNVSLLQLPESVTRQPRKLRVGRFQDNETVTDEKR